MRHILPIDRPLGDLAHLREHIVGRDQIPTLDGVIGIGDRLVETSQLFRGELDLLVIEAVDQVFDQLGAFFGRHAEHLL